MKKHMGVCIVGSACHRIQTLTTTQEHTPVTYVPTRVHECIHAPLPTGIGHPYLDMNTCLYDLYIYACIHIHSCNLAVSATRIGVDLRLDILPRAREVPVMITVGSPPCAPPARPLPYSSSPFGMRNTMCILACEGRDESARVHAGLGAAISDSCQRVATHREGRRLAAHRDSRQSR